MLLTGTPVQNDLEELFAMCNFANPDCLGTLQSFRRNFAACIEKSRDANATPEQQQVGQLRSEQLAKQTASFVLRRSNQSILAAHLPPKTNRVVFCRLSSLQVELYKHVLDSKALRQMFSKSCAKMDTAALVLIGHLRKICNHPYLVHPDMKKQRQTETKTGDVASSDLYESMRPIFASADREDFDRTRMAPDHSSKLKVVRELLTAARHKNENDRFVIVSNFTSTLDVIAELCQRHKMSFVRLDGSTPSASRQSLVNKFNQSSADFVFLLSAKAGGCGINLIGANRLSKVSASHVTSTSESTAITRSHVRPRLEPRNRRAGHGKSVVRVQLLEVWIFLIQPGSILHAGEMVNKDL
eukprot:SAG31_NODE_497_length_14862_cov_6.951568_11_plen_356_part_00